MATIAADDTKEMVAVVIGMTVRNTLRTSVFPCAIFSAVMM